MVSALAAAGGKGRGWQDSEAGQTVRDAKGHAFPLTMHPVGQGAEQTQTPGSPACKWQRTCFRCGGEGDKGEAGADWRQLAAHDAARQREHRLELQEEGTGGGGTEF